jgi:osmotically inducible protein OsmC
MDQKANARWTGDLHSGSGTLRLGSGAWEGPYTFKNRFEGVPGANPEELLGAAHAACFTMAISAALTKAGKPPRSIETTAVVHLNKVGEGFSITGIDLTTRGDVPGLSAAEFKKVAEDAKVNCIVSRALASVPMKLETSFVAG